MNLREAVNQHVQYISTRITRTSFVSYVYVYRRIAKEFWVPNGFMNQHPGRFFREENIIAMFDKLYPEEVAASTLLRLYYAVKSFTKWACDKKIISEREHKIWCKFNPVDHIRTRIKDVKARRPMSQKEYDKLMAYVQENHPDWTMVFRLGWETGFRFGDIITLRKACIDWDESAISLVPRKTKTSKPHFVKVPIHSSTLEALRVLSCMTDDEYLFPDKARTYLEQNISQTHSMVGKIVRASGIRNVTFHSMRHGFVSRLINKGVHPLAVASMTGQSMQTILRYTTIDLDMQRRVLGLEKDHEDSFRRLCASPVIPGGEGVPEESPELQKALADDSFQRSRLPGHVATEVFTG